MSTHKERVASMTADAGSGSRALKAILAGGLIGGAFDITYACTVWAFRGVTPIRVGQSVAAGLLGRDAALAGGVPTGLLGFVLHFSIVIVMALWGLARVPGLSDAVQAGWHACIGYRIATPQGSLPTAMSATFASFAVSITATVPERPHAT